PQRRTAVARRLHTDRAGATHAVPTLLHADQQGGRRHVPRGAHRHHQPRAAKTETHAHLSPRLLRQPARAPRPAHAAPARSTTHTPAAAAQALSVSTCALV